MAITFVNSWSNLGNANNMSVYVPAGVVDGDFLITCLSFRGNRNMTTPAAGWTAKDWFPATVAAENDSYMYWRIASSEPAFYSWIISSGGSFVVFMSAYRGVDTTAPFDAENSVVQGGTSSPTTLDLTATKSDDLLFCFYSGGSSGNLGNSYSTPAGMSDRGQQSYPSSVGGAYGAIFDEFLTSSGNVGTRTSNTSIALNSCSFSALILSAVTPDTTVNVTVSDIAVTDQPAEVTATTDAAATATTTNVTVSGQPVTITATSPNKTVNAAVSNIDIAGQPASVSLTSTTPVTVNATVTNIGIVGKPTSIGSAVMGQVSYVETFNDSSFEPWLRQVSSGSIDGAGNWAISTTSHITGRLEVTIPPEWVAYSAVDILIRFHASCPNAGYVRYGSGASTYTALTTSCVFTTILPSDYPQNVTLITTGDYTYTDSTTNSGVLVIQVSPDLSYYPSGGTVTTGYTQGRIADITLTTSSSIQIFNVSIGADVADVISVAGINTNLASEIRPVVSDIVVKANHPTITIPGQVYIGANVAELSVVAGQVAISTAIEFSHATIPTNIAFGLTNAKIRTMDDSFIFIAPDDSALTAFDAQQISGFDFGGFLYNQAVTRAFKIGNVGTEKITLDLSVQSINTEIIPLVEFSKDKINYSPTITIENIHSNEITDPIWVRMNAGSAAPGHGTFLVDVEQSNA